MTPPPIIQAAGPEHRAAVLALLEGAGLPLDGLAAHWDTAIVVLQDGRVVGCAALELYGHSALLRSLAVASDQRASGLGRALTAEACRRAAANGVTELYLFTTTAETFFLRLGFERIGRADVPAGVQTSIEFTTACPASAAVMRLQL